ncbi:hypothetical protein P8A22_31070 [Streptomyces laculatispora]|uniref:Uncharacterized protein n=1 Tax=Streptomyces laculatispora TaxID=887464 RepID=A0ABY9IF53_9ACTN|nr:hypothetical protein [Streptomyces laculatispora]WLQ45587.1 hypothetical protein P8A22_31070 [Streptomyces laculatispora]
MGQTGLGRSDDLAVLLRDQQAVPLVGMGGRQAEDDRFRRGHQERECRAAHPYPVLGVGGPEVAHDDSHAPDRIRSHGPAAREFPATGDAAPCLLACLPA